MFLLLPFLFLSKVGESSHNFFSCDIIMNLTAEKSLQICTVIKMPLYRVSPVEPDSLRNIENIFICPKKNAENNSKHHKSINI